MFHFIYKDVSAAEWIVDAVTKQGKYASPIVFECNEDTLTLADIQFQLAMGYEPSKTKGIIVQFRSNIE